MAAGREGQADLVAKAARGNRQAAEELVRALLPRVRNLVRYLVRGDNDVDDIAQSALLALLRGLSSYRGDAPVERWADRIVARETFRHLRRVRLRAERERPVEDLDLHSPRGEEDTPYLVRRAMARALDGLPEAQRVAIVLHHAAGFSVVEVADLLEVSPDTVKSRIRLGMTRLRTQAVKSREVGAS